MNDYNNQPLSHIYTPAWKHTETPPRIIAVVVLYATTLEFLCMASLKRTRLGLITAESNGPKKAIKLTWTRTAHFSHAGQFCAWSDVYPENAFRIAYQRIIFETAGLRDERQPMLI